VKSSPSVTSTRNMRACRILLCVSQCDILSRGAVLETASLARAALLRDLASGVVAAAAAVPLSLRLYSHAVVVAPGTDPAVPDACAGDSSSTGAPGGQLGAGAGASDTRHLCVTRREVALRGDAPETATSRRGGALRRHDGSETMETSLLPVATGVAHMRTGAKPRDRHRLTKLAKNYKQKHGRHGGRGVGDGWSNLSDRVLIWAALGSFRRAQAPPSGAAEGAHGPLLPFLPDKTANEACVRRARARTAPALFRWFSWRCRCTHKRAHRMLIIRTILEPLPANGPYLRVLPKGPHRAQSRALARPAGWATYGP
jgi:hypothetical protein